MSLSGQHLQPSSIFPPQKEDILPVVLLFYCTWQVHRDQGYMHDDDDDDGVCNNRRAQQLTSCQESIFSLLKNTPTTNPGRDYFDPLISTKQTTRLCMVFSGRQLTVNSLAHSTNESQFNNIETWVFIGFLHSPAMVMMMISGGRIQTMPGQCCSTIFTNIIESSSSPSVSQWGETSLRSLHIHVVFSMCVWYIPRLPHQTVSNEQAEQEFVI